MPDPLGPWMGCMYGRPNWLPTCSDVWHRWCPARAAQLSRLGELTPPWANHAPRSSRGGRSMASVVCRYCGAPYPELVETAGDPPVPVPADAVPGLGELTQAAVDAWLDAWGKPSERTDELLDLVRRRVVELRGGAR